MDLLDLIIVFLLIFLTVMGYRRGISWGGISTIGLILGAVVGALITPPITHFLVPRNAQPGTTHLNQPLVATGVFLASVLLIQGIGTAIGYQARIKSLQTRFAQVDSILGGILGFVGMIFIAWFCGFLFGNSTTPWLGNEVRSSYIEQKLTGILPNPPGFLARLQQYLRENSDIPNPFVALNQGDLPAQPIPASVNTPGIVTAQHKVSKVIASSTMCGGAEAGSAWPVASNYLVTNAHVVGGSDRIEIDVPDGRTLTAHLVLFDPNVDVAVLWVPGLNMTALPITPDNPNAGTQGAAIGYPNGESESVTPAAVRGSENAYGYNIYNDDTVTRNIIVMSADIIQGDSGGPLVDMNGNVIGMTFASSTSTPNEGYALSTPQIQSDLNNGINKTTDVSSGKCVS